MGVFTSLDESMRKSIRIRTFLGLPDPDPLVRGMDPVPDPSIIEQKLQENPWFLLFFDFLSLKNDLIVALKSIEPKNLFVAVLKVP